MTFAVAVATPTAVIVAADRRYTRNCQIVDHPGIKLCRLGTTDAHGVLAYAGAGLRDYSPPQKKFELSLWIERLLQGRDRLSLRDAMNLIAKSATEQRLVSYDPNHKFMFAGFWNGRAYLETMTAEKISDELEAAKTASGTDFVGEYVFPQNFEQGVRAIGSGRGSLPRGRALQRAYKFVRKSGKRDEYRSRAAALTAQIVRQVSTKHCDVSPDCIVSWTAPDKTGLHWSFDTGGRLVQDRMEILPSVYGSWGITAVMDQLIPRLPSMEEMVKAMQEGKSPFNMDEDFLRGAAAKIDLTPKSKF